MGRNGSLGRNVVLAGILVAGFAATAEPVAFGFADESVSELAQYYGFGPLELFKLQQRSGNMLVGDLNHDGLNDLVLVDNSNSRIDILQQRKRPDSPGAAAKSSKINAIANDWRFEHRKMSVDKAIASLTLGDFNGDGRTDIAYIGLPDRLILKLQPEKGEWTSPQTIRLPDLQPAQWMMVGGDLNHDQKDDLVVLGKNETYVLYQQGKGELGTPERLMNTSDKLGLAQIADLDGDGRNDLCYLANDEADRAALCPLADPRGAARPRNAV